MNRDGADRLAELARGLRPRVSVTGRDVCRTTLTELMSTFNVPAVSVAVLDSDGSVSNATWGTTPASTGTLFQAASISKPVTAVGAMRLASDGVFDLDQDVNELLRSWQIPEGDGVTVRRILSHSAGLSVHGFPGYEPGAPIPSTIQILDGVPPANTEAVRVVRPPGEAYQYSGGGFTLLELLLEDVTGEPFVDLVQRVVLGPLSMSTSTYVQPIPPEREAIASTGHDAQGEPISGRWAVHPEHAAAALWTTPTELLWVAAEMLGPGRVLDAQRRDDMLRPQVDESFGLSWALEGEWFQHGGSNAGFQALLYASVRHGRAAVVMANGDGAGVICANMIATVAEMFDWPGYLRERTAIELDAATMDDVAGDYELEPGVDLEIRHAGNELRCSIPAILPDAELFASSPTEFFRVDLDAHVIWTGDALEIVQGGQRTLARRRAP